MILTEHLLLKSKAADSRAADQQVALAHFIGINTAFLHFLFFLFTIIPKKCIQVNNSNTIFLFCPDIIQPRSGVIRLHFSEKGCVNSHSTVDF